MKMAASGPHTDQASFYEEEEASIHNEGPFRAHNTGVADTIIMANDRDRPMRDYAVFDPQTMNTGIVRSAITGHHFEFKPMMFQML